MSPIIEKNMAQRTPSTQEIPAWLNVMAEQVAIYDYRCRRLNAALADLRSRYQAHIDEREAQK